MTEIHTEANVFHVLLERVAQGDTIAFHNLYRLSAPKLLAQAWRYVRSREAAEEVVQESYIGIWRHAGRFDLARSQPMTWMSTIVRFKSLDYLRADRPHRQRPGEVVSELEQFGYAAGPEELVEVSQQIIFVRRQLASLRAPQRKAIELAFFSELTHSEVALEMTVPLGTVKTRIRRGCATLRKQLECHAGW